MERHVFLDKLKRNEPLFGGYPRVDHRRIIGSESEFSVSPQYNGNNIIGHMYLRNGGKFYTDCGHLEGCTPECRDPVSWLAQYEAMKRTAHTLRPSGLTDENWVYATNTDFDNKEEHTFGHHENYATFAPPWSWRRLLPYLVARTILIGSGKIRGKEFAISQRAKFITCDVSDTSTCTRPVLHLRDEPHTNVPDLRRIHLITGDDTMCEFQSFLRVGFTSLVVELLEKNALPYIRYDASLAALDVSRIGSRTANWYLEGIESGPRGAIELLHIYLEQAHRIFFGRDDVTDAILHCMRFVLEHLAGDVFSLFGYLDWPTKLYLLTEFCLQSEMVTDEMFESQDYAYHCLNPATGLYWGLLESGLAKRIVSDSFIEHCMVEPPPDTRAYARGKALQMIDGTCVRCVCTNDWMILNLVVDKPPADNPVIKYHIQDPFCTYTRVLKKIRHLVKRHENL